MIKRIILLAFVVCGGAANAGWYRIYNYSGLIGDYPVHVSIQSLEGVGETTLSAEGMDGLGDRVQYVGSYYYDKHRSPIALYGRRGEKGVLRLCEVHDEERFRRDVLSSGARTLIDVSSCQFRLLIKGLGASGKWSDGEKEYAVYLNEDGRLVDVGEGEVKMDGFLEIPFWGKKIRYMAVGYYGYDGPDCTGCVSMHKLVLFGRDAVRRSSIEVEFPLNGGAGMGKALIYQSVESFSSRGDSGVVIHYQNGGSFKPSYEGGR